MNYQFWGTLFPMAASRMLVSHSELKAKDVTGIGFGNWTLRSESKLDCASLSHLILRGNSSPILQMRKLRSEKTFKLVFMTSLLHVSSSARLSMYLTHILAP